MKKRTGAIWADRPLLLATIFLMLVGLVMVFSASANMSEQRYGSAYLFLRKQLVWDFLGAGVLFSCMRIDYHRWQKSAWFWVLVSVVLLVAVLWVGPVVKGARRWIHLGFFTFQPSELAKISLILWVSSFLDRHRSQVKDLQTGYIPPLLVIGLVCGLISREPDLGTPLMLGTVCMMLLYLSGARLLHMIGTGLLCMPALYYELFHVGYRHRRLLAFADPWADAGGAGYQLTQSMLAFGSGGLFGKGLGASTLKLLYLPDPHTDFIFPVIGEELGFIGAVALIALFVFWGLRGWQAARRAPDLFGQLLASGITAWVLLQAAINMGVSCGLLPTKGLPLPFVSFGGSSLVITMGAVGMLLNVSAQGQWERSQDQRKSSEKSRRR